MTLEKIKESLCYYDTRNPDNDAISGMSEQEIEEKGYGEYRKVSCSCDNCFYGRSEMAEELLKCIAYGRTLR